MKYSPRDADRKAGVAVVSRHELRGSPHWQHAFASHHKDHRYYDLVDETIHPEFQYLYFVLRDPRGHITAVQPFFIIEQDILTGVRPYVGPAVDIVRKLWPRFMFMKSMMVGCVAGEAHLDDASDVERAANAELLARSCAAGCLLICCFVRRRGEPGADRLPNQRKRRSGSLAPPRTARSRSTSSFANALIP